MKIFIQTTALAALLVLTSCAHKVCPHACYKDGANNEQCKMTPEQCKMTPEQCKMKKEQCKMKKDETPTKETPKKEAAKK